MLPKMFLVNSLAAKDANRMVHTRSVLAGKRPIPGGSMEKETLTPMLVEPAQSELCLLHILIKEEALSNFFNSIKMNC